MKLDLSLKDWTSNTRDQLVQLASCCIVGIIQLTNQKKGIKKVLKLFRSKNYAAFISQGYYKTTTRKAIASCKWKFTWQETLYTELRYMSGSSSIFDPRAQCARNKHYKLWCHHMALVNPSASSYPASVGLAQTCPTNTLPRLHFSLSLGEYRHLSAKLGNHRGLPQDLSSAFSYRCDKAWKNVVGRGLRFHSIILICFVSPFPSLVL